MQIIKKPEYRLSKFLLTFFPHKECPFFTNRSRKLQGTPGKEEIGNIGAGRE
jgi:hypothetical protein